MIDYIAYLNQKEYSPTTIQTYTGQARLFIHWCTTYGTTPCRIDYKTFLHYISALKQTKISPKTLNHRIGSLKLYFNYLVSENYRSDHPIENIQIQGVKRSVNHLLLSSDQLEDLYYSIATENQKNVYFTATAKRAKALTGLLVYQGLTSAELSRLTLEELMLTKGKVYVPRGKKSNSRSLELKPWQIIELMDYCNEVRPLLQKRIDNYSAKLFPSGERFSVLISSVFRKLKRINQKAQNSKQIRASVITNWLGQYNLREVQYRAGHRYISSTEKYLQDDLENLHEIIHKFHPIS